MSLYDNYKGHHKLGLHIQHELTQQLIKFMREHPQFNQAELLGLVTLCATDAFVELSIERRFT